MTMMTCSKHAANKQQTSSKQAANKQQTSSKKKIDPL
jgi:hypothetical protein